MRFSTLFAGALLALAPAFVAAQQQVIVGMNGTLTFNPPAVTVPNGGTVQFIFMSKNHSVYQSSFTDPCTPIANGFQAPFFPIASDVTDNFPTITLKVTQTAPLWFYCPQTNPVNHCHMGMVGSINALTTGNKTFADFQAAAMGTTANSTSAAGTAAGNTTVPAGSAPVAGAASATGNGTSGAAGNGTASTGNNGAFKTASSGLTVALALVAGAVFAL
ncbi:hypothetical protein M422DRAFT_232877 [Sphaerobolus stellatus SS14]|uniref:Cupredoxin n=1 Tax=Sphaerobolus stellatus (strain SS14) TaxID=990650 RepID=A0A0C9VE12_SPHS4|nr:hypothetical protein M422DRAFT_232877 [Sphaerobolus stellatus SS14]